MEEAYSDPLVSVIVPIYNVECYIRKCLDSLMKQTLRQIEVICIDDGSTDQSGVIAEEYRSDSFPKIRVIHTVNRGLSAARNRGINESRAGYLMFVDSDDWVEPDFCRVPYLAAIENQADMVIFQTCVTKNGKTQKEQGNIDKQTEVVDEFVAIDIGGPSSWNRLYKKELFEKIRYPEERTYEDIAITHKLVHEANLILMQKDCLYHHIVRKGSITQTHTGKNKRDRLISAIERNNDLASYGYANEKFKAYELSAAISYLNGARQGNDKLRKMAEEIVDSVHKMPKGLTGKQRIALKIWRKNKQLFYLFCWLGEKSRKDSRNAIVTHS